MKISYQWLKSYIPDLPLPDELTDVFTLHLCEIEGVEESVGERIFDLNILPNRAHDLLSHQGVARELSGQLGIKYNDPIAFYKIPESKPTNLKIDIQTPLCRRYMARIVRGVKVGPSPEWVVKHLESIGQRSINNIVDATNICMFDCGQPMHAFDLKKLSGEKIIIRFAQEGETMTTLDKKDVVTKSSDMVIADDSGVLALAGVKGGTKAEVDENTTDILLEVANFDPATVRKTARRLGIFTDSAKRFENDLSPELRDFAMKELTGLLMEYAPEATYEEVVDVYPTHQEKHNLTFSLEDINKKLGAKISADAVEDILKRYSFEYTKDGNNFTIVVPALRLDLTGTHDMVEEIGRIIGYDKVVPTIPKIDFSPKTNDIYTQMSLTRKILLENGYNEVMNYAFCKKGKVEVARAAKGKEFLRTNLADGIKESYELNRLNESILELNEIKIFEIGSVFPQLGTEELHVAIADKGGVKEFLLEEFVEKISDANNISKILIPIARNETLDYISKFNSQNLIKNKTFVAWSHFPFIARDIAMWVPENTDPEILIEIFVEHGGELLARPPRLFDTFSKEEKKSFAFRLVFQSQNKTLVDDEVNTIVDNIHNTLRNKGFTVR